MEIHHGNCLDVLRGMPSESIDSIVTDPPYGLSFMGKRWDYDVPSEEVWRECLRVLKPGGHLLAFAGTRTQHRMAVRIEDAGFEIRDMIAWVYGSGFPKSLDVSKAIDKAAGVEREVVGSYKGTSNIGTGSTNSYITTERGKATDVSITAPATPEAQQWAGWGTALKPALEPITVARKPLEGTVAENVLAHGTGAVNIDGCRVPTNGEAVPFFTTAGGQKFDVTSHAQQVRQAGTSDAGRWPANLIHDGSEEVVGLFPESKSTPWPDRKSTGWKQTSKVVCGGGIADSGSAARFFYCAKASKADRDEGCEGLAAKNRADQSAWVRKCTVCGDTFCDPATSKPHCGHDDFGWVEPSPRRNHHPTVKPTDLMRYLCRLVTPPGGLVLDPFMGSGSTGKAALLEGFCFVGIEREAEYVEIARARIVAVQPRLL